MKKYQNEGMVLLACLLMLGAFLYKNTQVASARVESVVMQQTIDEFKTIVTNKRIWADKQTSKKVDTLLRRIPSTKVKWRKKGNKLTANYKKLSAKELNTLVSSLLNLGVQIEMLEIQKSDASYGMEFVCKW